MGITYPALGPLTNVFAHLVFSKVVDVTGIEPALNFGVNEAPHHSATHPRPV
jgi:hypothetical protein